MKSKKIVIDLLPFDNKLTGTGYFFVRLLDEILKVDKLNQYELHLSNQIAKIEEFNIYENIEIVYHRIPNFKLFRVLYEQFIFPFTFKADILYSPSVAIPFIFKFSARTYITTIHDLTPFFFKKYNLFQQFYVKSLTKFCAIRSDLIITVSDNSRFDIEKLLKISPNKIVKISNFLPSILTSNLIETKKEKFFLTVSTVQPGKNLKRLIQAFKLFVQNNSEYKLLIIGDLGWRYNELFILINDLKLNDFVLFKGYTEEDELNRLYQTASALLYVSIYEGFGIPPLEAMHFGCPIVVSNCSSLPEVAGSAGIYVDPYDVENIRNGIEESLSVDLNLYIQKAKIQVEKFNATSEANKFLNIINSI